MFLPSRFLVSRTPTNTIYQMGRRRLHHCQPRYIPLRLPPTRSRRQCPRPSNRRPQRPQQRHLLPQSTPLIPRPLDPSHRLPTRAPGRGSRLVWRASCNGSRDQCHRNAARGRRHHLWNRLGATRLVQQLRIRAWLRRQARELPGALRWLG